MALNLDSLLLSLPIQRIPTPPRVSHVTLPRHHVRPLPCTTTTTTTISTESPTPLPGPMMVPAETADTLHLRTFTDYLDLDADAATPGELVKLLNDGKVGEIDSMGCPEGTVIDDVDRRRNIFVSIVLQKIILSMAAPGTSSGLQLMNLLAENDLSKIIWDFFSGQLKMPDPNSMQFKSPFAFIDTRVTLDNNIKPGDSSYNPHLCIMAAKLAYENAARIRSIVRGYWNMEFLGFYNCWEDFQDCFCTQGFMMSDKPVESGEAEMVVVAFRGTDDAYDACTDIDFSWYEVPGIGKMHGGFMKALGLQKNGWPKDIAQDPKTPYAYYIIREKLRGILKKNLKAKFLLTGHSLGGALSALFPIILKYHGEDEMLERLEGVYTFGQPRVGDRQLGEFAEKLLDMPKRRYFRFVYSNDLVPRVPFDDNTWMFKHFGKCLYYDSMYRGKELVEEPNENYFASEYAMTKQMDAMWEFMRSFTIGHIRGPDYHESAMLRMMRVMGLMIPGLPAHSPQDYNNITRLGTLIEEANENSN